jgi:hypothetical protein
MSETRKFPELLSCPFCGGVMRHYAVGEFRGEQQPKVGRWNHPSWPDTPIGKEAARCPAYGWGAWDDEIERIEAWNRRHPLTPKDTET